MKKSMENDVKNKISLKDFLKKYTAVSVKFIDEYYKFYEMCEEKKFNIDVEDVIKYLQIKNNSRFYENLRKNYIENIDYIKKETHEEKKDGQKYMRYIINLDTFEKICLLSKSEKANSVRDYFIILRKFIYYYKNHISEMIINNSLSYPDGNVYIILANKNKNIFKFGKSKNIRKRLQNYATGKDKHPDIQFIMLVDNRKDVEDCVKKLSKEYQFKPNQEIYKIDIDTIKNKIFNCASIHSNMMEKYNNQNIDSYIIFDNNIDADNISLTKNSSKKKYKRSSKKNSRKNSKKNSRKKSKKNSKRKSKKI